MTIENRISAFEKLGDFLNGFVSSNNDNSHELEKAIQQIVYKNGWFTPENIRSSISAISLNLNHKNLSEWLANYSIDAFPKNRISIIMAGNIPLVGFHDLLCVLISGNIAMVKMSSKDNQLLSIIIDELIKIEPNFSELIHITPSFVKDFDAVIATGNNDSFKHFDYYFKDYPKILRRSRTSVAVLDGNETLEERKSLAADVFMYFGLGCRNVTKLFLPSGYNLDLLFEVFYEYKDVILNNKYANNYDYYKAIYLMGNQKITENGFLILKEDKGLHSPVGVLNYEYYDDLESVNMELDSLNNDIQCVVKKGGIPFGNAQFPKLNDYADGVDTLAFLEKI
ncbi:MAG: acyl-CoA reductase [Flavobacteriales bacterium]|nr:acyl-CoA reductase [Flavobacteriales bacterium]